MGVYSLLFRKGVERRTRFQALLNVLCSFYMISLVVLVTCLGFFHVVPTCYRNSQTYVLFHRVSIGYSLLCCISHYVTCVFTDPSVKPDSHGSSNDKTDRQPKYLQDKKATQATSSQSNAAANKTSDLKKRVAHAHRQPNKRDADRKKLKNNRSNNFYCSTCRHYIPDRVHHCYLCEACIDKRDHHCFFMGVCIGQSNQKYFIYFTLFMGIGTMYGVSMISKYLHFIYGIQFFGPQTFLTLFVRTVFNVFVGRTPSPDFFLHFFCLYASLFGTMFAFSFFCWQVMIVYYGQTTHEARQGISTYTKPTALENFADVLGDSFLCSLRSLAIPFVDIASH